MVDTKVLSPEALLQITSSLNISMHSLVAVISLLDEGGTVPFIARYRKEAIHLIERHCRKNSGNRGSRSDEASNQRLRSEDHRLVCGKLNQVSQCFRSFHIQYRPTVFQINSLFP